MAMPEKAPRDYNSVNGLLNSMTKTELTIILDFLRERKSGNKPLLVDRIKQWLHNEKCTSGENGENWIRVTELMYNTLAPRRGKAQVPLTYNDGASSISRRSTSAGPQRQSHSHNAAIRATLPYGRPGSIGYNTYGNNNIQPPHTYPNNPQANSHSQLNPQLYPASGATTGTTASQGLQTKFTVNPFFRPLRELCPPTRLSGSGSSANITLMFRLSSVERASFMELDYRVIIRSCTEQAPPGVGSGEPRKDHFPEALRVQIQSHSKDYAEPPLKKEKKVADTPKDITEHVRLHDLNRVQLRASSRLSFHVCIQLVQYSSVETLIRKVRVMTDDEGYNAWQKILKPILDMDTDSDISSGPSQISMMCPVGCIRMQYPARGKNCPHIQCFDARIYISMNERRPAWMCPVCNRKVPYDDLVVDGHYQTVIAGTTADKVYVKPGERECPTELDKAKATSIPGTPDSISDEKENIEILDDGSTGGSATPPVKAEGTQQSTKRSTPGKASATPDVIDLCSDDDDDVAMSTAIQAALPRDTSTRSSNIKRDPTLTRDYNATLLQQLSNLPTPRIRMSQPRPTHLARDSSAINRTGSSANRLASINDRSASNPTTTNHSPLSHMSALDNFSAPSDSPVAGHGVAQTRQPAGNPYLGLSSASAHVRTNSSHNFLNGLSTDTFSLQPRSTGLLSSMDIPLLGGSDGADGDQAQLPLDTVSAFYLSNMSKTTDDNTSRYSLPRDNGFEFGSGLENEIGSTTANRTRSIRVGGSIGSQSGLSPNPNPNPNPNSNPNNRNPDTSGGLGLTAPYVSGGESMSAGSTPRFGEFGTSVAMPFDSTMPFSGSANSGEGGGSVLFGTWGGLGHGSSAGFAADQNARHVSEDTGQTSVSKFGTLRDSVSDLRARAARGGDERIPEHSWTTTSVTDSGGRHRRITSGDLASGTVSERSMNDIMTDATDAELSSINGFRNNLSTAGNYPLRDSGNRQGNNSNIHSPIVYDYPALGPSHNTNNSNYSMGSTSGGGLNANRGSSRGSFATPQGIVFDGLPTDHGMANSGQLKSTNAGAYTQATGYASTKNSTGEANASSKRDININTDMNSRFMPNNVSANPPAGPVTNTWANRNAGANESDSFICLSD